MEFAAVWGSGQPASEGRRDRRYLKARAESKQVWVVGQLPRPRDVRLQKGKLRPKDAIYV